jgi:hypothetical protein
MQDRQSHPTHQHEKVPRSLSSLHLSLLSACSTRRVSVILERTMFVTELDLSAHLYLHEAV